MIQFKVDGVDTKALFKVQKVIFDIGNERSISTEDLSEIGTTVTSVRDGAKTIRVQFALLKETPEEAERVKHAISGLFKNYNQRFEFSVEPDKYYLGFLKNKITPDYIARWFQTGELELFIPDGVAHATTYKRYKNPTISGKRATFALTNDGNRPAIPIITVNHATENGYLGIVNQTRSMAIGDNEETDTVERKKSVIMHDYQTSSGILSGFEKATKNVAVLNDGGLKMTGAVSSVNVWGRPHLHLGKRGGTTGANGGSLSWSIPADSNGETGSLNEYLKWRQIFWAGSVEQYGFLKVTISDTDGNFLYGVETFKRSNGTVSDYNFMVSDGDGGYEIVKHWQFHATHKDIDNPFNQDRGWCDLLRRDDKVQVFFFGGYYTFTVPEIAGKKSAKIHVAFGSLYDKPIVTHMYLDQLMYRKDFVSEFVNIPNTFGAGSNVVINFENDTVSVDKKINNNIVSYPGWNLKIPPGTSELDVFCSSWADVPEISVSFEERWQ